MGLFQWFKVWTKRHLQRAERPGLRAGAPEKSRNGDIKSTRMGFRPDGIHLVCDTDVLTGLEG